MIILSGNCPRHHNAIMLELTDFDDSKISYLEYLEDIMLILC